MSKPVTPLRKRLREIGEQSQRPSGYRAYLAEDYDGIGQHVLITLARGSTAGALRARLAAGDFGTGQTIPVGTPITVFSLHGQLEILSLGVK